MKNGTKPKNDHEPTRTTAARIPAECRPKPISTPDAIPAETFLERLREIEAEERRLQHLDLELDGLKEEVKERKCKRAAQLAKVRSLAREWKQGRLFPASPESKGMAELA